MIQQMNHPPPHHHPSHNPWSVLLTASSSLMTFDPGTLPFERLSQNKEDTV